MLIIGSCIRIFDNSGAREVKIISMRVKQTFKRSYVTKNNVIRGTITKSIPHKKVQKHQLVLVLITGVCKKINRQNGIFFNFTKNFGIVVKYNFKMRFDPVGTKVSRPTMKEVRKEHKQDEKLAKLLKKRF